MADSPLWSPSAESIERANLTRFMDSVRADGVDVPDYPALWRWSVDEREAFWAATWRFFNVIADTRADGTQWDDVLVGRDRLAPPDPVLGPRWFTGARLNFAEHLLRHAGVEEAIVSWDERGEQRRITRDQLRDDVARAARMLRQAGVGVGDRVAGFLPNIPEAVVAMLATASIGATWSSCSPDFGAAGVLDRFGQIEPKVLVVADGYRYAGKEIDIVPRVAEIVAQLPGLAKLVIVSVLRPEPDLRAISMAVSWNDAIRSGDPAPPLEFTRLPFDHPLYIMYSSGTTGLPKCMVHGAGGTLIQHLKELSLHTDVRDGSRIFYFTTCGWMMWNWLVSSLALGATIVLYDGAPLSPRRRIFWDIAESERLNVFGVSAKYLALAEKSALKPREIRDLSQLEAILSTGSPLAAHSFDYVYRDVKPDVRLSSISGGTDIVSCFALGNPLLPVWRGELQCRGLGMAVEVFDESGQPVVGEQGELVCTAPFPSMPVAFWNDPDGAKYRAAYFEQYPNAWRHGDWCELTEHGGIVISGRSDATLNPQGVRIGTAEIYRQVEQLPEVVESLVVGQDLAGGEDVRIVLFVRLQEGLLLDDALRSRIRDRVREFTTPHHVPKVIVQVADIPRTISGKITELAVREVIHGRPVKNADALANPEALELYRDLAELRLR
ncbi:MAG: acsA [Gemmatimonadetes bacterium]|nr:acsA [Gemmatimonadota bacterium]